jgi:asparagine synthase (glutamine-hydrolysing)
MALGDELPAALDGQFAFVIIDDQGRWLAARDHVGICPLYMGRHADGTIWFASEMKALVDDCEHVELVEPGTAWSFDGEEVRSFRWYDPAWRRWVPDEQASLSELRETLTAAVEKRLMSDVPWGVLLSGGVDSSLVASITSRIARERGLGPIHTFAIGLEGGPDLEPARRVAEHIGSIHHEFTFTIEEAMDALPHLVEHLESDQQIRTGVPTYLLAQRVSALGFKMVLSGEGADEIFGGYLYFHKAPSGAEFHRETVRKTTRLHQYDVMRANKAPMAFGLELRFPYLDRAFSDLAMSTDPAQRGPQLGPGGHLYEKALLRRAFASGPGSPWLPDDILWRRKEQFSDGVGYGWVDALRDASASRVPMRLLECAADRFPELTPDNAEMYWMREMFEARFVAGRAAGRSPLGTIGSGRSVACSTPEAMDWDPTWLAMSGDISGRSMEVHCTGEPGRASVPEHRVA